jgi:hypothetical protein
MIYWLGEEDGGHSSTRSAPEDGIRGAPDGMVSEDALLGVIFIRTT